MQSASAATGRLLFVEDEARVAKPIKRGLAEEGDVVDWRLPGIDVTISTLRRTLQSAEPIGDGRAAVIVETERGVGYRLSVVT